MPATKIAVDLNSLIALSEAAMRNGTQDNFIPVAMQWAVAAQEEIDRLTKLVGELKVEISLAERGDG